MSILYVLFEGFAVLIALAHANCSVTDADSECIKMGSPVSGQGHPMLLQTKATAGARMAMPSSGFFEEDSIQDASSIRTAQDLEASSKALDMALHDVGTGAVPVPVPEETMQTAASSSILQLPPITDSRRPVDVDADAPKIQAVTGTDSGLEEHRSAPEAHLFGTEALSGGFAGFGSEPGRQDPEFLAVEPPVPPAQPGSQGGLPDLALVAATANDAGEEPGHSMSDDMMKMANPTGEEGDLIDRQTVQKKLLFANKPESELRIDRHLLQRQNQLDDKEEKTKQAYAKLKANTYQSADYSRWRLSEEERMRAELKKMELLAEANEHKADITHKLRTHEEEIARLERARGIMRDEIIAERAARSEAASRMPGRPNLLQAPEQRKEKEEKFKTDVGLGSKLWTPSWKSKADKGSDNDNDNDNDNNDGGKHSRHEKHHTSEKDSDNMIDNIANTIDNDDDNDSGKHNRHDKRHTTEKDEKAIDAMRDIFGKSSDEEEWDDVAGTDSVGYAPVPSPCPIADLGPQHGGHCTPICKWSCEAPKAMKTCEAVCEPVCKAPKCETRCPDVSTVACSMECTKPHCSVMCSKSQCINEGCPSCATKCNEPQCKLKCPNSQKCKNVCEHPECDWKCKAPTNCPKPDLKNVKCKMVCETHKSCHSTSFSDQIPPLSAGQKSVPFFNSPFDFTDLKDSNYELPSSMVDVQVQSVAASDAAGSWEAQQPQRRMVSMPVLHDAALPEEAPPAWVPVY